MASLLTTVWLVLAALSYAAILERAGFLERLLRPIVARARSRGTLIAAVNASGIGLNVIAGDQYVADVLPARMYRDEFDRRGIAPEVLSRAVEDSGTVTSVLVPWNTCGAYISGVLGVSTASYLPYCFFNLASPILDVLYGFVGFKVREVPPEDPASCPPPETGVSAPLPVDRPADDGEALMSTDVHEPPVAHGRRRRRSASRSGSRPRSRSSPRSCCSSGSRRSSSPPAPTSWTRPAARSRAPTTG